MSHKPRLVASTLALALSAAIFPAFLSGTAAAQAADHAHAMPMSPETPWAKERLEKSPRHREWVSIKAGNRTIQAYVVYPEVSGKVPVVVVIHEIFGLSDWAREMTDEIAAQGYIAIAPDFLSGFGPKGGGTSDFPDQEATIKAVSGLNHDILLSDLNATVDYARKLPAANGKLATAGFCWGGAVSFAFATHRPDLNAAFVFYGPPPEAADMSKIQAPVYGFYGGNDSRIDSTIPATVEAMKAAGKKYDPVTYDGAGHGFMRAGEAPDATPANQKAREEGFARLTQLLKAL